MAKLIKLIIILGCFFSLPAAANAAETYEWGDSFAFSIYSQSEEKKSHPFLMLYPENKVADDAYTPEEVDKVLTTIRWARGKSKLNSSTGLSVMFRTIAFTFDAEKKRYTAVLEGEFNAFKVDVAEDDMRELLAGKATELTLKGAASRSVGVFKYVVSSANTVEVRLVEDRLFIDKVEANCTISYVPLLGAADKYISPTIVESTDDDAEALYIGIPGKLKGLPVLK